MDTTTFADIKLTEDTDYYFENQEYSFNEGDVVSLPRHTARKFVHNWNKAEWTETRVYEVREDEYDEVAARIKNSDDSEVCGVEKSNGEECQRQEPCRYHD